jgi:regulator of ribonuclease activity B
METSDDADRATLAALAQAGSKLAEPHQVRHFLYFGTKRGAKKAAREIARSGYSSEVSPGASTEDWLLLATHTLTPSVEAIRSTREFLEGVADRFGGEYDGWEAQVEH